MESVPDKWRLYVGQLGFGMAWTIARALNEVVINYGISVFDVLFWNSILILSSSIVQGFGKFFEVDNTYFTVSDNKLGTLWSLIKYRMYLLILAFLWLIHGFWYYATAHELDILQARVSMLMADGLANCEQFEVIIVKWLSLN